MLKSDSSSSSSSSPMLWVDERLLVPPPPAVEVEVMVEDLVRFEGAILREGGSSEGTTGEAS